MGRQPALDKLVVPVLSVPNEHQIIIKTQKLTASLNQNSLFCHTLYKDFWLKALIPMSSTVKLHAQRKKNTKFGMPLFSNNSDRDLY